MHAPSLDQFRAEARAWLAANADALPRIDQAQRDFHGTTTMLRSLQAALYDANLAQIGWPAALGGRGGDARHRAVLYEELARAGYPERGAFEHVEIVAPALAKHWDPTSFAPVLGDLLRGTDLWCQGFSEPDAGSDLAAMRTRADAVDGGYLITGRKIWTSWASESTRCFVLARSGTPESRHRGLSAFCVPLSAPGVDVNVIRQANGEDELAEVSFDGVFVPTADRIGDEGTGWQFALDVLACERSAFVWVRQLQLIAGAQRLLGEATDVAAAKTTELSEVLLDLYALRSAAAVAVTALADGTFQGPDAAPMKVMLTRAEQRLYDTALSVFGPRLALGIGFDDVHHWQSGYLFSRAVSIYGGTRQIQLTTIARFLLGMGGNPPPEQLDEMVAAASGVLARTPSGRGALNELEWSAAIDHDDPAWMAMLGALFRAHGRTLANTPALSELIAAQLLDNADGSAIAAFVGFGPDGRARNPRIAEDRAGHLAVVVPAGVQGYQRCLVPTAGGYAVVPVAALTLGDAAAFDDGLVQLASVAVDALESVAVDPRRVALATAVSRIAIAHEILGACERMMTIAVQYCADRKQFDAPIGSFQAVQHLLAEAEVDMRGLRFACAATVRRGVGDVDDVQRAARLLKALAGRVAQRVGQATLQSFGAIGFTWEHDHHRFLRRTLTLDALSGSLDELRAELVADGRVNGVFNPEMFATAAGAGTVDGAPS